MADNQINRLTAYTLTYIYAIGGYLITNHFNWRPIHYLPLTPFDLQTPFLDWSGWIYISVYFVPMLAGVLVTKDRDIRAMLYCFNGVSTFCFIFFLLYPTIYPRPLYNLNWGLTTFPLYVVYSADKATNCWPSLHVVYAFLSAFFVRLYKPKLGNFLILWAVIISISTLTTKQHYMWDVVAGYILARLSFKAAYLFLDRVLIKSKVSST
jgi:membrane-associated phospholipid phosphatase